MDSFGENKFLIKTLKPVVPWRLEDTLSKKTIQDVKKWGETNPEEMNVLIKIWAEEVWSRVKNKTKKEGDSSKSEKQKELQEDLKTFQAECLKNVKQIFRSAYVGDFDGKKLDPPPCVSKSGKIKFRVHTHANNIYLDTSFENPNGYAEYTFDQGFGFDEEAKKSEGVLLNRHREISLNFRTYGIGQWIENLAEKAARDAGFSKLYFRSSQEFNSIMYPLLQGYCCQNNKDRDLAIDILKFLYDNPEKYRESRVDGFRGLVEFKKEISPR